MTERWTKACPALACRRAGRVATRSAAPFAAAVRGLAPDLEALGAACATAALEPSTARTAAAGRTLRSTERAPLGRPAERPDRGTDGGHCATPRGACMGFVTRRSAA